MSDTVIPLNKRQPKTKPFNDGDIVWLKSGGPALTVRGSQSVGTNGPLKIDVDWFVSDEWMKGDFFAHQLTGKRPSDPEEAD